MPRHNVSPAFALLRMARCEAESSLTGPRRKLLLKFEQQINVELQEVSEGAPLHGQVSIHFDAIAFEEEEAKPELKAVVDYVAEFRYPGDAIAEEVKSLFETHEHQRELVMQAYPVAVTNFRELLATMGLPGAILPLTPP